MEETIAKTPAYRAVLNSNRPGAPANGNGPGASSRLDESTPTLSQQEGMAGGSVTVSSQ